MVSCNKKFLFVQKKLACYRSNLCYYIAHIANGNPNLNTRANRCKNCIEMKSHNNFSDVVFNLYWG